MDLEYFRQECQKKQHVNNSFYERLRAKPPRQLDSLFHAAHERVFDKINCLSCANCCKTTSPIFYDRDIERAAKALKLKPSRFAAQYLRQDEDGDQVLQQAPCPFLDGENYCVIYEARPQACREYPHTNRKRMHQILNLTMRNTMVCPAVLAITAEVKNELRL